MIQGGKRDFDRIRFAGGTLLLFVFLSVFFTSCAVQRVNIDDLKPSRTFKANGPIDATLLVYLPIEYKNQNFLDRSVPGRFIFIDGQALEETLLKVGAKYFKTVKTYLDGTSADFVLAVDGVLVAYPAPSAFHASAVLKANLFGADGEFMGAVAGKHFASSDWTTMENNIYNNFARASLNLYDKFSKAPLDAKISEYVAGHEPRILDVASLRDRLETELAKTGSGFIINSEGDVVTNHHVVDGCIAVSIAKGGQVTPSSIQASDQKKDIAILRTEASVEKYAALESRQESIRLGEEVVTLGFPLHGVLTSQPSLTTGVVSALAGMKDDKNYIQISAPVQSGNSGGPLLNSYGQVIGVVSHKLNAIAIAQETGTIPENVNFAVRSSVLAEFLRATDMPFLDAIDKTALSTAEIAQRAEAFTVQILCDGIKKESIEASLEVDDSGLSP